MSKINVEQLFILLCADVKHMITFEVETQNKGNSFIHFSANKLKDQKKYLIKGEFKHEVRQFEKSYDNQQAEQISLMV